MDRESIDAVLRTMARVSQTPEEEVLRSDEAFSLTFPLPPSPAKIEAYRSDQAIAAEVVGGEKFLYSPAHLETAMKEYKLANYFMDQIRSHGRHYFFMQEWFERQQRETHEVIERLRDLEDLETPPTFYEWISSLIINPNDILPYILTPQSQRQAWRDTIKADIVTQKYYEVMHAVSQYGVKFFSEVLQEIGENLRGESSDQIEETVETLSELSDFYHNLSLMAQRRIDSRARAFEILFGEEA